MVENAVQIRGTIGSTGHLLVYGMGTLPQLRQGAAFPYAVSMACGTMGAGSPCIVLGGSDLTPGSSSAHSEPRAGQPVVSVGISGAADDRLEAYARTHKGSHLAIVLDGMVLSDAPVQNTFNNGLEISGIATMAEAQSVAVLLACGALPAAFSMVEISQISVLGGLAAWIDFPGGTELSFIFPHRQADASLENQVQSAAQRSAKLSGAEVASSISLGNAGTIGAHMLLRVPSIGTLPQKLAAIESPLYQAFGCGTLVHEPSPGVYATPLPLCQNVILTVEEDLGGRE
jgi:hypothetical protein